MSHPVELTLSEQDGSKHQVAASFSDDEWKVLQAYLTYAQELSEAKLLKSGFAPSANFHWNADSGWLSVQAELPDWDGVIVVLHRLRPIILEKESTYFAKVRSILGKRLDDASIRAFLKQSHDIFVAKRFQSQTKMTVNDEMLLNSEQSLKLWLNAHEYHRVPELQAKFAEMTHMITFDGARAILLLVLVEKIRAIFQLASLVNNVLGMQKSFSMQVDSSYLNKTQSSFEEGNGGLIAK